MKTSDMILTQIHTPVRRVRFSEQMEIGIRLMAEGTFLSPLSSTKPKPANHVRRGLKCTRSKTGRLIERSIYAENYERNRKNTEEKEQLYRRRQAIVEHPFGTIKRQWGFSYILTKEGINRASADVGFMFIAYNIRRIISILGKEQA